MSGPVSWNLLPALPTVLPQHQDKSAGPAVHWKIYRCIRPVPRRTRDVIIVLLSPLLAARNVPLKIWKRTAGRTSKHDRKNSAVKSAGRPSTESSSIAASAVCIHSALSSLATTMPQWHIQRRSSGVSDGPHLQITPGYTYILRCESKNRHPIYVDKFAKY